MKELGLKQTRKMAVEKHCNLKAAGRCASGSGLRLYEARNALQTTLSTLPRPLLDLATSMSSRVRIFW